MSLADAAEQSLKGGDPAAALAHLQEQVRAKPADSRSSASSCSSCCACSGQWERALNQLKVASDLDPEALAMAQIYGDAVRCEAVRDEVFEGKKSPMIFGEPDQWLALLIESLLVAGRRRARAIASELRARAFDDGAGVDRRRSTAGRSSGSPTPIRGSGPVLEAVINGRYYWVPFSRLSKIDIRAAGGPARPGLDAGAPAVRERRRVGGADSDPLSRLGGVRRRPDRAGAQDRLGRDRRRHASRARPAHHRHRRRRGAAAGDPRDRCSSQPKRPSRSQPRIMAEQPSRRIGCSPRCWIGSPTTSQTRSSSLARRASCRRGDCGRRCCAIWPGCSTPPGSRRSTI